MKFKSIKMFSVGVLGYCLFSTIAQGQQPAPKQTAPLKWNMPARSYDSVKGLMLDITNNLKPFNGSFVCGHAPAVGASLGAWQVALTVTEDQQSDGLTVNISEATPTNPDEPNGTQYMSNSSITLKSAMPIVDYSAIKGFIEDNQPANTVPSDVMALMNKGPVLSFSGDSDPTWFVANVIDLTNNVKNQLEVQTALLMGNGPSISVIQGAVDSSKPNSPTISSLNCSYLTND